MKKIIDGWHVCNSCNEPLTMGQDETYCDNRDCPSKLRNSLMSSKEKLGHLQYHIKIMEEGLEIALKKAIDRENKGKVTYAK